MSTNRTPPAMLSSVDARNALCSLYPDNTWAAKYRDIETDKRAYRDREWLIQIIQAAPLPTKDSPAKYREWYENARKILERSDIVPSHLLPNGPFSPLADDQ